MSVGPAPILSGYLPAASLSTPLQDILNKTLTHPSGMSNVCQTPPSNGSRASPRRSRGHGHRNPSRWAAAGDPC